METDHTSKGEQTKARILDRVNALFNEKGVDHTIAEIAEHIGMGKSRITNYFPRKDLLIVNLLKQHEQCLDTLVSRHQPVEKIYDFGNFIPFLSDVMELTFGYRGVIAYAMIDPGMDNGIQLHIKKNYAQNKARIRKRLEKFERNSLITPDLLDPETFEEYFFQYACMSSNWIISHNLLNPEKNLETVKLRYIRSILCCLKPYLTEKGRQNLENALNEQTEGRASG